MPIAILREEDQQVRKHHTTRGSVKQKTKKKRQQRAQSRLALARFRQHQREQRQRTAAHRAEQRWNKTLRQLVDLGATLKQLEETGDDRKKTVYEVTYEGKTSRFRSRFGVQRWLKREREHQEEQQMSWAERHVRWMIEHNVDDHSIRDRTKQRHEGVPGACGCTAIRTATPTNIGNIERYTVNNEPRKEAR